ncbi:hypothetical protein LAV82_23285 [Bacillus sp. ILBB4]|nr:hypothetical protein [Bacillus sp. ILBB4]
MSKTQFDKMKVNLWVSGTTDQKKNGGWCAHLHCFINGKDYTKTIGGYASRTTLTRMSLLAVYHGLSQLRKDKPVFVHIYTSVVQVSTGLNRNMWKWAQQGWLTTKNEHPKHVDLWQQIYGILSDNNRVLSYKVHLQNQASGDQPYRLLTINNSAEYLLRGKQDLYEVSLT